jgi:hypothetical protein
MLAVKNTAWGCPKSKAALRDLKSIGDRIGGMKTKHNKVNIEWGLLSIAHNMAKLAVIRPPIFLSL